MNSLIPAARASSIAYWISGRSTKVMISFGIDLVAGRNRVPIPATGKMARVTFGCFLRVAFTRANSLTVDQPAKPASKGLLKSSRSITFQT
jgi:hypothetical protein